MEGGREGAICRADACNHVGTVCPISVLVVVACIEVFVCVCVCVSVSVYVHTHTHTHTLYVQCICISYMYREYLLICTANIYLYVQRISTYMYSEHLSM